MVFTIRTSTMSELSLETSKQNQHHQPEYGTDDGNGDLAQCGSGTRRCRHPDSCSGGQSVYFRLIRELENGAAAQEPDARRDALNDSPQRVGARAGFSRAHDEQIRPVRSPCGR